MDKCLVLSDHMQNGFVPPRRLAEKIENAGIPVFLTKIPWPRDELFFFPDGHYDYCDPKTSAHDHINHVAYGGGAIFKGSDFIISSNVSCSEQVRARTHEILGVKQGFYYDLEPFILSLYHLGIGGSRGFLLAGPRDLDAISNISNPSRSIFVYDTPVLVRWGEELAERTGYKCVKIPLWDAQYAGIGFEIIEQSAGMATAIVDCRARTVAGILQDLGHSVILSPFPMEKTNRWYGSIHCITNQIPIAVGEILTFPFYRRFPGIDLRTLRGGKVDTSYGKLALK